MYNIEDNSKHAIISRGPYGYTYHYCTTLRNVSLFPLLELNYAASLIISVYSGKLVFVLIPPIKYSDSECPSIKINFIFVFIALNQYSKGSKIYWFRNCLLTFPRLYVRWFYNFVLLIATTITNQNVMFIFNHRNS